MAKNCKKGSLLRPRLHQPCQKLSDSWIPKPERVCKKRNDGTKKWNKGTKNGTMVPKTGTRAPKTKAALLQNRPFASSRIFALIPQEKEENHPTCGPSSGVAKSNFERFICFFCPSNNLSATPSKERKEIHEERESLASSTSTIPLDRKLLYF